MNISFQKIANEIYKILRGIGYTVEIYDENGNGPISSPKLAKYIYTKPDNLMIEMPSGDSNEVQEITIYKPDGIDLDLFKNLFLRIKNIARLYGLEVTVRNFGKNITPKDFSEKPKAREEERKLSLKENSIPHLFNYFKF